LSSSARLFALLKGRWGLADDGNIHCKTTAIPVFEMKGQGW